MNDNSSARLGSDEEDLAAIRAVLAGDTNAFAQLDRKYRRKLYGVIRSIVRNDDDAEDLVQDTLMKAYRALRLFNPAYSFEKWLFKIASNTCIDYLRRRRFAHDSLQIEEDDEGNPPRQYADDSIPSPDEPLLRAERTEILRAAIASLPEKYRVVIELRHTEELEYAEIAQRLGLPLGTVKAHLFRARQMLLKKLAPYRHLFEL